MSASKNALIMAFSVCESKYEVGNGNLLEAISNVEPPRPLRLGNLLRLSTIGLLETQAAIQGRSVLPPMYTYYSLFV